MNGTPSFWEGRKRVPGRRPTDFRAVLASMDRRRRMAPLLVAALALSGGHALLVRSAGPLSPEVCIAWHRTDAGRK